MPRNNPSLPSTRNTLKSSRHRTRHLLPPKRLCSPPTHYPLHNRHQHRRRHIPTPLRNSTPHQPNPSTPRIPQRPDTKPIAKRPRFNTTPNGRYLFRLPGTPIQNLPRPRIIRCSLCNPLRRPLDSPPKTIQTPSISGPRFQWRFRRWTSRWPRRE